MRQAVIDVIQLYFDGLYEGDTAKLTRVFHPSARLYSLSDGEATDVPRDAWLAIVASRAAPQASRLARTDRIVAIDITDDVLASAKVECSIHPRYFVDQLSLLNTAAGWQIVAKVFRTHFV
jgi:hypothetical protein